MNIECELPLAAALLVCTIRYMCNVAHTESACCVYGDLYQASAAASEPLETHAAGEYVDSTRYIILQDTSGIRKRMLTETKVVLIVGKIVV